MRRITPEWDTSVEGDMANSSGHSYPQPDLSDHLYSHSQGMKYGMYEVLMDRKSTIMAASIWFNAKLNFVPSYFIDSCCKLLIHP